MSRYLSMLFIFQYLFRVCQSCAQRCCVEQTRGISPQASHRTVRDSLPSYGSSYSINTFNSNNQRTNGTIDSDIVSELCPTIYRLSLNYSYTVYNDTLPIVPVLYAIYKTLWTNCILGIFQSNVSTLEVLGSSDAQCQ